MSGLHEKLLPLQPSSSAVEANQPPQPNGRSSDESGGSRGGGDGAIPLVVLSTVVASCGTLAVGCAIGYASPVGPGVTKDLNLSIGELSIFGSILTFGGMIGSILTGKTSDLIGRKGAMWVSQLFFLLGWLAIAFAKESWALDLGRLLTGVGVGMVNYAVPVYVAEITPKKVRGAYTSAANFMSACGFSVLFFAGTLISWRLLALITAVPSALQILGLFFVPESPRWLAKVGREEESKSALQRLRGANADISREAADIIEFIEACKGRNEDTFVELFQLKYAHAIIVVGGLMVFSQFCGNSAIENYARLIFEKAGFPSSIGLMSISVIPMPMTAISILLTDRIGRRPLLMASTSGLCISSLIIGLGFCLQSLDIADEITPYLIYVGILGFVFAYQIGMSGLPWLILSEIFPINIKGTSGSIVTFINWCSALLVSYSFNFLAEWSSAGTFFIFSGISFVAVVFVVVLVPETKGRTLEELQTYITTTINIH